MGTRYLLTVKCPKCGKVEHDVYYAPTCGFVEYTCQCGHVIDLQEETGISYDDASNRAEVEAAVEDIAAGRLHDHDDVKRELWSDDPTP